MKRVLLSALFRQPAAFAGRRVTVAGWVHSLRRSKAVAFAVLRDGSSLTPLQVVLSPALENYDAVASLGVGSAVVVTGEIVLTPDAPQPLECRAETVEIEGAAPPDYPLQKKRHTLEYLRTLPHLRPRANTYQAAFRLRSAAALAIHRFFAERGFCYIHTPILTASDAEGAGAMFRVTTLDPADLPRDAAGNVDYRADFFGKRASLTVSGQLEGECMALALGNVYTFGPTFRAERSNTPRHAAEFWMIEPEIAFADLEDDMELAEEMLRDVLRRLLDECADELAFFETHFSPGLCDRLRAAADTPFARVTYTEAVRLLEDSGKDFVYPVFWGCDLQTEHERYLTEEVFKKPVFVTDYPREIKAFYMRQNDDGRTVAAMDLLAPGIGEIIGGSQREERLDLLEARMRELGMRVEDYRWYLDLRRYGGVRHAGFGLGFERLLLYVTGLPNIRDVLPFPRTPGSIS